VPKAVLCNLLLIASLLVPGAATAQRSGGTGYTEDRINQLQQTIVELTRRLEQLQKQNQQLQQHLEKVQASYEQRLERLEKGTPAKPPPVRKVPPKP
jgi:TolA-binding protein